MGRLRRWVAAQLADWREWRTRGRRTQCQRKMRMRMRARERLQCHRCHRWGDCWCDRKGPAAEGRRALKPETLVKTALARVTRWVSIVGRFARRQVSRLQRATRNMLRGEPRRVEPNAARARSTWRGMKLRYRRMARMARMARSAARTAARANAWTAQGRGGTHDSLVPPRRRRVSIGPGGECGWGWTWEREHTDWYGAAHNARAVHRRGARIAIFDDFPSLSRENKRARIDRATGGVPGRAAWRVRTACVLASPDIRPRAPTSTTARATTPGTPNGRVAHPHFINPHQPHKYTMGPNLPLFPSCSYYLLGPAPIILKLLLLTPPPQVQGSFLGPPKNGH